MDAGNSSLETIDFDLIIERFTSYFSTSCTSTDNSEELPLVGLRALVVDDSTSCRLITSLLLKKYDYQVTGVSGGFEALKILREKPGYFDLVVSDVHMPEMCGLQLLQCIMKEFPTLPVFLISGDNDREMVRRGIESGATFYLTKPLKNSDVEKLWQHVFTRKLEIKNMKQAVNHGQCSLQHQKQKISIIDGSSSKANEQETVLQAYQSSKGKKPLDVQLSGDKRSHLPQVTKNGKGIVWTETLQSRFLQAVEYMGVKDAEPKQILDHMKVPGLTLKNVATHLQRHREKVCVRKSTKSRTTTTPLNVQPRQNPQVASQYSFSSFQRDQSGVLNVQPSLLPTINNQRLMAPVDQPWVAHDVAVIENEQTNNQLNIATINNDIPIGCGERFLFDPNFDVSEYLLDNDDNNII